MQYNQYANQVNRLMQCLPLTFQAFNHGAVRSQRQWYGQHIRRKSNNYVGVFNNVFGDIRPNKAVIQPNIGGDMEAGISKHP